TRRKRKEEVNHLLPGREYLLHIPAICCMYGVQRTPDCYKLRMIPHRKFIPPFETLQTWCEQNLSTCAN
ncbi:hypothetical protein QT972_28855, partial [Microcoleus sp. herbarium7]|uniref:hypothetical protein n=1 Tax=unclassified Microcoleus TaxID=2642155 RepID=UPI002FD2A294